MFQFVLEFSERGVLVSRYVALSKSFDSDERLWQNWTVCLHFFLFFSVPLFSFSLSIDESYDFSPGSTNNLMMEAEVSEHTRDIIFL